MEHPVSWLMIRNKFNQKNPLQIYFCSDGCQVQYEAGLPHSEPELALIHQGLSPQEAHVLTAVDGGERPSDVAKRLGVSRQAVSDALRRGKIKMAGKG